ncbi:MAG: glycosyltransferase [Acidimicrobiales bacterium]
MSQRTVPQHTAPQRTVALDCRWLSFSGAGRVTEMLLKGLQAARPPHRWVLWGPPGTASYLWPGAEHVLVSSKPTQLSGQREWFAIPPADLVVFMHQQRPLRRVPALSMVLDTTPVRYNRNRVDAWAKTRFLRRVGEVSKGIITISDFSSRCIQRDLGVKPERITTVGLPADADLAHRVLALRAASAREDVALYVGLFLPHKNLPRLIEAFGRTGFRRRGGRLLLVGGKDAAEPLRQSLDPDQHGYVEIWPGCSQEELERLYASSRFLVQPSLEEGFGLPVQEALSSGLPVCVSNGGALPEVTLGLAEHFEPTSVTAMTGAIDNTAEGAVELESDGGRALSAAFLARTPTSADLARQILDLVDQQLR